jgi:hypothetical protein
VNEDRVLALYFVLSFCLIVLLVIVGVAGFVDGIEHATSHAGALVACALALTGAGALITAVIRERRPS